MMIHTSAKTERALGFKSAGQKTPSAGVPWVEVPTCLGPPALELRIRVPDSFLLSSLVGEPSPKKG